MLTVLVAFVAAEVVITMVVLTKRDYHKTKIFVRSILWTGSQELYKT